MKRVLSLICILLMLLLTACAPDNIITSSEPQLVKPVEDTTATPEPEAEPTVTEPTVTEEPETEPDTNVTDTETEPVTEDEPETKPETDNNVTDATDDPIITDVAVEEVAVEEKEKNESIASTFEIDGYEFLTKKTADLNGETVTMYMTEASAFSVGSLTEHEWFAALKEQYGLEVKLNLQSDGMLYHAQSVAQRSGMEIDLVRTQIADGVSALSLTKDLSETVQNTSAVDFSASVFNKTGNKLFTAKGVAKTLWYNTELTGESSPQTMFKEDAWTVEKLSELVMALGNKNKLIECSNWSAFASAGGEKVTGLWNGSFNTWVTSESSIETLTAFHDIFTESTVAESGNFSKGTSVFAYTDTPYIENGKAEWAPIPKYSENGVYTAEYSGYALGVSKTARDTDLALTVASLWSVRYTEARLDSLINDFALTTAQAIEYIDFCETNGGLYCFDKEAASFFDGKSIPAALCTTPDAVYNSYYRLYDRSDIINARYL